MQTHDADLRVSFEAQTRAIDVRDLRRRAGASPDDIAGPDHVTVERRDELSVAVADHDRPVDRYKRRARDDSLAL